MVVVINVAREGDDLTRADFVSSSEMVAVVLMLLVSALDTLGERSFCRCSAFVCDDGVFSVCISVSLSLDALDFRGRSVGPMLRTDFRKSLFVHFGLSAGVIILAGESPFGAVGGNACELSGDFCFVEAVRDEELFDFASPFDFSLFVIDFVEPLLHTDDMDLLDDDELLDVSLDLTFFTDSVESLLMSEPVLFVEGLTVFESLEPTEAVVVALGVFVVDVAFVVVTYLLSKNDVHEAIRDDLNLEYFDVSSSRSD